MKPGDKIKIKLSGDVVDAKVLDCRNKKTIWVEVLWSKTRIHALTSQEKKANVDTLSTLALSPITIKNLNEATLLALAGKKVVHQSGSKRIKIPRAKVVDADSFRPQVSKSILKRQAIQKAAKAEVHKETTQQDSPVDLGSVSGSGADVTEPTSVPEQLSAKDRLKAKLAAKKGDERYDNTYANSNKD